MRCSTPGEPEERKQQLQNSVAKLNWPLVKSQPVTVPAGSFVVMSHNTYHRGSRKFDSIDNPDAVRINPFFIEFH